VANHAIPAKNVGSVETPTPEKRVKSGPFLLGHPEWGSAAHNPFGLIVATPHSNCT